MKWAPFRASLALVQLVVLLAMQLAEGTGVHRCPQHDAMVEVPAGHEPAMHDMMGHEGHAQTPGKPAHSACHCIGTCSTASVIHHAPAAPELRLAAISFQQPQTTGVVSLRDTVRLLPFAIGPPSLA